MFKQKRARRSFRPNPKLTFSYKKVDVLKRFITEQGTILSRLETSLTQKQQRRLAQAVKRARHLAMLPFTQTI